MTRRVGLCPQIVLSLSRRDCSVAVGVGAQAEFVESLCEAFGRSSEHGGEHMQLVAPDREHPAVELLALKLDGCRVVQQHRSLGVVDNAEALEVDPEALV